MDAFAVSIVQGVHTRPLRIRHAAVVAGTFGVAQGIMPIVGWLIGAGLAGLINRVDHWIIFALLGFLGVKMIRDAFVPDDDSTDSSSTDSSSTNSSDNVGTGNVTHGSTKVIDTKQLVILAVATSIDALALGVTFALLDTNIWFAASIIALMTFIISLGGVYIGSRFGERFKRPAEVLGGVVLIIIGVLILIEHLTA